MSQHVASQIIAAVTARLAPVAPVHLLPMHTVPIADLPGLFIEAIEDGATEIIGSGPLNERHTLSFELFGCCAATSGFAALAGDLRTSVESALLATKQDVQLAGLCRPGLRRISATFRTDAESLEKPVGGWVLKFTCVYHLKTDAPDLAI